MRLSSLILMFSVTFANLYSMRVKSVKMGIILDSKLNREEIAANIDKFFYQDSAYLFCPLELPEMVYTRVNVSEDLSAISLENGTDAVVSVLPNAQQIKLVHVLDQLCTPHIAIDEDHGAARPESEFTAYTSPENAWRIAALKDILQSVVHKDNWKTVTLIWERRLPQVNCLILDLSKMFVETRMLNVSSNQLSAELLSLRNKGSKHFLVLASRQFIKHLLLQAKELDMFRWTYFWMFFSDDTSLKHDEEAFSLYASSNIMVIKRHWVPFKLCCDHREEFNTELSNLYPGLTVTEIKIIEAVSLLDRAFRETKTENPVETAGGSLLKCISSRDGSRAYYIMEQLRKGNDDAFTSSVGFDTKGSTRTARYDLFSTTKASRRALVHVGEWEKDKGITLKTRFFLNQFVDFAGQQITVASLQQAPFYIKTEDGQNTGFIIDILNELAAKLNFSYIIKEPRDRRYGDFNGSSWDGMVGMIVKGEADIAVGPFTVTSERARAIEFSKSFMEVSNSIMSKKVAKGSGNLFQVFTPFAAEVWCSIAGAMFLVGFISVFINRLSPYRAYQSNLNLVRFERSVQENLWSAYSSVSQQGPTFHPSSTSARCLLSVWWVFTTLVVSMYTAVLAAYLTVSLPSPHISSLSDLVQQENVGILITTGSNGYSMFRDSNNAAYQKIWMRLKDTPYIHSDVEATALMATGDYTFISDTTVVEYIASQECGKYIVAEEKFNKGSYAFVLPKGTPYENAVNFNLMKIVEAGLVDVWKKKWWNARCPVGEASTKTKLRLNRLGGLFIVYIMLAVGASVVFAGVKMWKDVIPKKLRRQQSFTIKS